MARSSGSPDSTATGRPTLCECLRACSARPASGPIVIGEHGGFHPINSLADASRHKVAYVSGDRKREGIFANLSIFENMLAPLYRAKSRGGKLALIDWTALNGSFEWEREKLSIRLGDRADKITSLSGGNQQKVLIGRAFALSPNILILNDPARGVDIAAKTDLYAHLRDFAATGKSVVYMSSEIEELIGFCSRVLVFRNGHVFAELTGEDINSDSILAAMFGQHRVSRRAPGGTRDAPRRSRKLRPRRSRSRARLPGQPQRRGRLSRHFPCGPPPSPTAASFRTATPRRTTSRRPSPGIRRLKARGASRSRLRIRTSRRISGSPAPSLTGSSPIFPPDCRELPEGASRSGAMPHEAREFASDFVTFRIPGYGRGYGGPWPPDDAHRYVFTLYALKTERIELDDSADYVEFVRAVLPSSITTATLVGLYGPAKAPLPKPA